MLTRLSSFRLLLGVLLGFILFGAQAQPIRYVKPTASGLGDGSSWANASANLQAMINASASGNQVWIAGGTYKPSTTGLSDPRNAAFSLKNNVSVLGGFTGVAGSEGNVNARTAIPSSTTLSGDIGTLNDPSDNCFHVFNHFNNGLNNTAILDGIVITKGNANGGSFADFGGGMINILSSPTVLNCQFVANSASVGGGMAEGSTNSKLTNCSFSTNSGSLGPAGIYVQSGSGVWTNCFFGQNTGSSNALGGAVFVAAPSSSVHMVNCTFSGNRAVGGSAVGFNDSATMTNCLLWNNNGQSAIQGSGNITINYSLLEAGATNYTDGGNNQTLTASPFANATGPQLLPCSAAIDAGNNAANSTTTDVLDNTRTLRTIDIGAAEFEGTPYTVAVSALATPNPVCADSPTSLQATASNSLNGPYTYTWTAPAGASLSSTSLNPTSATATTAGVASFSILVSDAIGCQATSSVNVTVNALPTLFAVTGGGSYCAGGTGVAVGLSDSQTGVSYQLLRNGAAVGSALAGTGNALAFSAQTVAATYTVRATNITTSCQQVMTGSVTVSINSLPTATLTNDGPLTCAEPSVTLTASGGTSYTFTNGGGTVLGISGPTTTRSVTTAGTYSVRVANASGCVSTTTTTVTGNTTPPTANIHPPASTTLTCLTTALSLTATGGGTYRWENATTAAVRSVTAAGTYSVTVTSPNGCTATDSQVISVNNTLAATAGASSSSALVGSVVSLSATGGSAYLWSAPTGASLSSPATSSAVSATLTTSGVKTFTVVVSQGSCSQSLTVDVNATLPSDPIPIRYVKVNGSGDGSSWANASGDLQAMINAEGVQQVWVAAGTYKPTSTTARDISFSMKNGVSILGGFPASGNPGLAQRVPDSYTTTLSGDIGIPGDNSDNSYNVIYNVNGSSNTAVLDGFVITGGNANDQNNGNNRGGGIFLVIGSPIVMNCQIIGNSAIQGGGLFAGNQTDNARFINCSFLNNTATQQGGAIYATNANASPQFFNCTFSNNHSNTLQGSCIYATNGNAQPSLTNCIVWNNDGQNAFAGLRPIANYCLIEPAETNYNGADNLTADPQFVNAAGANYRLQATSPAVNTGSTDSYTAISGPATDLASNARIRGASIDIGAYELAGSTDLAPTLYTAPATMYGTSSFQVVVRVIEVNGAHSNGLITVHIPKSPQLSLSLDPSLTSALGQPVQNSLWTLDATSNTDSYILTTPQAVGSRNILSVGLSGVLTPGQTRGSVSISTTLVGASGGEVTITNNTDADQLEYFNK